MRRRRFLKHTLFASAAMLGAPAIGAKRKPHVVVVGGGFGGAIAAKYLRMYSRGQIEVTLIEQHKQFVSCPMSNLVLVGLKEIAYCTQQYDRLADRWGVRILNQRAEKIQGASSRLILADASEISYDRLVVSPGIDLQWDAIEGMDHPNAKDVAIDAWQSGADSVRLRDQIQALEPGGVVAICIPLAPYRCPSAPYERASLIAWYLKKHKPGATVHVYDANQDITTERDLYQRFWQEHYKNVLFYHPENTLVAVDIEQRKLHFEFEDAAADVLNILPPMRAGRIAIDAGLATSNDKWCEVDFLNFESVAQQNIHILGDSIQIAPLMPKSGHMAAQHGRTCAYAICDSLLNKNTSLSPVYANTCFSFVSESHAMHVASVHHYSEENKTMESVKGAGGVSTTPSPEEAPLAVAWADAIWADMFQ